MLSPEELHRLRAACDTPMRLALLELLASTGAWVPDLAAMDRTDVDLKAATATMGRSKPYTALLTPEAVAAVEAYLYSRPDDDAALFVRRYRPIRRQTRMNLLHSLKEVQKRAGIPGNVVRELRLARVWALWRAGQPNEEIAKTLGLDSDGAYYWTTQCEKMWRDGIR